MTRNHFHLESAIAAWRALQEQRHVMLSEDLDELESHLREHTRRLVRNGMDEKTAFEESLRATGDFDDAEYGKIYWQKLKRRRELAPELAWRLSMFKNYFKVAFRSLKKQKGYAFINIFGLAIGLACFILILLFVQHEFSYDRFYEHADRIYRVVQRNPRVDYKGSEYIAMTQPPMANALVRDFPEVEVASNFEDHKALLSYERQHFLEMGIWAGEDFLNLFSIPILQGDPSRALEAPMSIVLTAALAEKIFGDSDPIGKQLIYENTAPFTVTGVVASPPIHSTIQYAFLTSYSSRDEYVQAIDQNLWNSNYLYTFFRLRENSDPAALQAKLGGIVENYMYAGREGVPAEEREDLIIQPLAEVHLRSDFNHDIGAMTGKMHQGDIGYLYLFLAVAIIILVLACVNYVNLAIARSIKRGKEVGLRKTIGAGRRQVFGQFIGESMLIAGLAMILGMLLTHAALPFFAELVDRPLEMGYLTNPWLIPGLVVLLGLVGTLSGSYPAMFMAALEPMQILKGNAAGRGSRLRLQHFLTVAQYTASIALIACAYVIYQQLQFIRSSDPGYDREHVITIRLQMNDDALDENIEVLRNEWMTNPNIHAVTASSYLPTSIDGQQNITDWAGSAEGDRLPIYINNVDYDFLDAFGLKLVAGRNFSPAISTDRERGKIINEAAARALGWTPEEAVGQRFSHRREPDREVIGVLKDFHLHPMHVAIQPVMFTLSDRFTQYLSVKASPEKLPDTIDFLRAGVAGVSPYPFEYQFLDERFDRLYRSEERLGKTFAFFTALALLIASLGLFGLAAFAAEQRTKEIGVRKVLGASAADIVVMLTKDFTRLVLAAVVVAVPIAYYAMQRWLENFAYHVDLGPGVFLLTGGMALLLAALTVSYQAIRAAVADPVKTIRYE